MFLSPFQPRFSSGVDIELDHAVFEFRFVVWGFAGQFMQQARPPERMIAGLEPFRTQRIGSDRANSRKSDYLAGLKY